VIVLRNDTYVKDSVIDALLPPFPQFAIQSLLVKSFRKTRKFQPGFAATGRIVIGSQIGQCGVKANQKLHLLRIYYIVIRSQLKCLIGAKALS
jgi:hypothetical protein